jgi:hypothetical protein
MKLLLTVFEQLSGLKINFHKSGIFYYGKAKEFEDEYIELFGCKIGEYPFRYLGIPMHHRKLLNIDRRKIEERFEKKLSCWKAKHLSYGGRLILINFVLSSLPLFMMSFFETPKEVLKKLDQYRSRFFWQGGKDKKKYHLAKWDIICRPKDQGGLGIINLQVQNKALLSKWIINLLNTEGAWQTLLRNKYLSSKYLTQAEAKQGDSHFWRGLMKIKEEVLANGSFRISDGTQTRFWEDTWASSRSFKNLYPNIYNICHYPHATVANVMSSTPLNISFRRALVGEKLNEWLRLVAQVSNFNLTQGRDTFVWHFTKSG